MWTVFVNCICQYFTGTLPVRFINLISNYLIQARRPSDFWHIFFPHLPVGFFPGQEIALLVIQRRQGAQQKIIQARRPSDFSTPLFSIFASFCLNHKTQIFILFCRITEPYCECYCELYCEIYRELYRELYCEPN